MTKKYKFLKGLLISLSVTFLSACATSPTINYTSNPPNAIISYKTVEGGTVHYYTPRTVAYNINFDDGSCKEIDSPSARWPDDSTLDPIKLRVCHQNSNWIFVKPQSSSKSSSSTDSRWQPVNDLQSQKVQKPAVDDYQTRTQKKNIKQQSSPTNSTELDEAKSKCAALGFRPKTEKFGSCVMELSK
jgi:hypothetical protein